MLARQSRVGRWTLPPGLDYALCSRRGPGRTLIGAWLGKRAQLARTARSGWGAQPKRRRSHSSGSPRRSYFRCVRCWTVAGPHSAVETPSPGCASSAPAGSMPRGFTKQPNPEESAALTHAVLEHELFKRCFEQVAVSRISGERPSVEVYALCKGSCNMTAEDRWKHPGRSSRPRSGAFDPAKCLTEALKDLVSRHKECFQPQITELTWERLTSSWAVAGPSASHATTEPPSVTAGDGCGDTSTAMTEQEARVVKDAVMPPITSDDSEMPNTEQHSQARPHLGGRLLR